MMSTSTIKQEPEIDTQDSESQEARLFNVSQDLGGISANQELESLKVKQEFQGLNVKQEFQGFNVKQEFYTHPTPEKDQPLPIYGSPYFGQHEPENQSQLNFNFDYEVYNRQNGWNAQGQAEPAPVEESAPLPKSKKGRKPKVKQETTGTDLVSGEPVKQRRKFDRFNGVPEEEVAKKFLPNHLAQNLDILIIGINPGLYAAHVGHHYAGPGNHFWKCMFLSGLISEPFNAYDDFKMLEQGIGFTNMVARTSRGSKDLSKKEIKEGGEILKAVIQQYRPRIAVFNGKSIYEVYSNKKKFFFGVQPEKVEGTDTHIWVMPSSSARCAQLPRAIDKVPFYAALRKFRDYLTGKIKELDEAEIVFTSVLTIVKKEVKLETEQESFIKEESNSSSPSKARKSPQKRKSEQTVQSKKK